MANADALFLALGLVAFAADCAVQYAGYQRYLGAELRAPDPALREAALRRWIRFYLIVESMVVIVVLAWVLIVSALPLGLLLGSTLPLQPILVAITRAGRG
ncbi:MAG: hypothetical protein E6J29_09870 [Chloroflexi bacterium]|nr:MAG: hypothetical protein E6J29_09870 [Chloroflexota bacterium]